jgi:uncharacterized protein (TIGR02996 family)
MSDRDALIAAIRQAPRDDAPRLIFADWLDEHGDPDQAEFIRLQIEIDPYRLPDGDLDRWQRAVIEKHLDLPVPDDFPPELRRYAELARRERDVLKAHRWEWLRPLARVDEHQYSSHLGVTFRRGFAEEVEIAASAFLESGDLVREACPVLRRLTLYGIRDQVPELAGMAALGGIPELVLADWITGFDARALVPSLTMRDLDSLTFWIGSRHDSDVIRTLATRPWDGGPGRAPPHLMTTPHLPELRDVVLVQLHGGLTAAGVGDNLDRRANSLAGEFNRVLGRPVARVERPWARRFPLNAQVGHGLLAGHIRGRPALVTGSRQPSVYQFDADGGQTHQDALDLDDLLPSLPGARAEEFDERDLLAVLRRDHGFVPGPIFVREFAWEDAEESFQVLGIHLWGNYQDVIEDPDSRSDGDNHEETCAALDGYWMRKGNFEIVYGNEYWAGPDGVMH